MTIEDGDSDPIRGRNPRPADGWPWHLTEYEVAYVREFNVRPVRDSTWSEAPDADARLDQEADGVRQKAVPKPRGQRWIKAPVKRRWPWYTSFGLLLAIAALFTTFATLDLVHAYAIADSTAKIANR